jgi:predicted CXXCH cytochrome family protein
MLIPQLVFAVTIVGSKHDLYTGTHGSDGDTTPGAGQEVCVFCHTPHSANTDLDLDGVPDHEDAVRPPAPLWNRRLTNVSGVFTPYTSSTMDTSCDATPSPLSLACLSCHDQYGGGAVSALGGGVAGGEQHVLVNSPNPGVSGSWPTTSGSCSTQTCHVDTGVGSGERWQIGPDLGNDHPISLNYGTAVTQDVGNFNDPPTGSVKLFNGRVECPSCHNVHDPQYVPFLRQPNSGSGLCFACHNK